MDTIMEIVKNLDWTPLFISFKTGIVATVISFFLGLFAAMDVVETEPIPEDSPLLSAPNVLITPHIAWAAKETRQRLMDIAVENLSAYVHGKPIHVVNLKSKG